MRTPSTSSARGLKREFDFHARSLSIADKLETIVVGISPFLCQVNATASVEELEVRSTIYIPDPVLTTYLYQLVDYYPVSPGPGGDESLNGSAL